MRCRSVPAERCLLNECMNSLPPTERPAESRQRVDRCPAKWFIHGISPQLFVEHLPCFGFFPS